MSDQDQDMGFMEHIADLRKCLLNCAIIFSLMFILSLYYNKEIFDFLKFPFNNSQLEFNNSTLLSPLTLIINISIISGFFLSIPFIIYEFFKFIAPALSKKEKSIVRVFGFIASLLFITGSVLCYSYMLPRMIQVMEIWKLDNSQMLIDVKEFLTTMVKILLGIGIGFQFPLVTFLLVYIGLVERKTLEKNRGIIAVIILILSAFLTPPEPLSMLVMATPMYVLFEISLIACRVLIKDKTL